MEKNKNGEKEMDQRGMDDLYIDNPLYITFEYRFHVNKTGSHAALRGNCRGMSKKVLRS